jgi:predicted ArsR family transcriptional regulator
MSRYTVQDAADMLGITTGAVRNRLSRGTLRSVKEGGRVYVLLPADTSRDTDRDTDRTAELIATLREQLQAERRANEENRRIIAALTQRIPEIEAPREAPSEPRESPTDATEQPGRVEPQPQVEGAQAPDTRPWWQRWFGSVDR